MKCSQCGAEIPGAARFCPRCGARNASEAQNVPGTQNAPGTPGDQATPTGTPGNSGTQPQAAAPQRKRRAGLAAGAAALGVLAVAGVLAVVFGVGGGSPTGYSPSGAPDGAIQEAASSGEGRSGGAPKMGDDGTDAENGRLVSLEDALQCEGCHEMAPYGVDGVDKWGNVATADYDVGMCASHHALGYECLDCHKLTEERLGEMVENQASGNYVSLETQSGQLALVERNLSDLVADSGTSSDEFCLNEDCHQMTHEDLVRATPEAALNPHSDEHGETECGECHKAHRASVNQCSSCHDDADIPNGWVSADENKQICAEVGIETY